MVMHARKTQRLNDGYFEKHQTQSYQSSKYSSKRGEYERDRPSNYRDRNNSPLGSSLNNGGGGYRSQSPDIDSPSSRGHDIRDRGDHRGGGGGDRYSSYMQKMRDRDRDVYKKDKYSSDKRDRRGGNEREAESHRTNHDRLERRIGAKLGSSGSGDKRSGSDDRERDRDRERDLRESKRERDRERERSDRDRERERERDRNERSAGVGGSERDRICNSSANATERSERGERERVARCGDWTEHFSSSGKMYYYNCKTEVSQWEKPKEWIERDRNLARDQHREKDYRDKERDRVRDDRFARSASYTRHSSSRSESRLRWNFENDSGPATHRRRLDGRTTTDTSDMMDISPGDSTPTSEASYSMTGTPTVHGVASVQHNEQGVIPASSVGLPNALPRISSHNNTNCNMAPSTVNAAAMHFSTATVSTSSTATSLAGCTITTAGAAALATASTAAGNNIHNNHRKIDAVTGMQVDMLLNSSTKMVKIAAEQAAVIHMRQQQPTTLHHHAHHHHHLPQHAVVDSHVVHVVGTTAGAAAASQADVLATNHANSIPRDNLLNNTAYMGLTHPHGLPQQIVGVAPGGGAVIYHNNAISSTASTGSGNSMHAHKTVDATAAGNAVVLPNSVAVAAGATVAASNNNAASGMNIVEGPPTPTQELDNSGSSVEQQRKLDTPTSSASLSALQGCVPTSVQVVRAQETEISPKLAKYFRADLITHVTNWPADLLEKQAQKISEEKHLYGDLQCAKISADLKNARSFLRTTEIKGTLREQKLMYTRQQLRRLEESITQNSFMSDDQ